LPNPDVTHCSSLCVFGGSGYWCRRAVWQW
jgi:hypothetical protein